MPAIRLPLARIAHPVLIAAQIGALYALNRAGHWLADTLALPLPGNLVGMLLLFALLLTGAVKLQWIESGASLLIRHLAFFFVPIAVGLLAYTDLLASDGWWLLAALLLSAALGIYLCGACAQLLNRWRDRRAH
jgi:holin-like protein